ncbi:hypothetical protein [Inhella sp.]|uniref:hypothetical protein n=1 Tax=Inhella sp. TaxID=1921806 RepID=UPI0035B15315
MRALVLLLIALALAWVALPWRDALPEAASRLPSLQALPAAVAPPPEPARRCEGAQGRIEYVTGACPAGTRERALAGGTVNVLPAVRGEPGTAASAAASATPLLQRLSDPEGTAAMQRKMQERLNP